MTYVRLVLGFVFATSLGAAPNWASLGGQFTGKIAVVETSSTQVFVRGADSALWTNQQNLLTGIWSGWTSLGGSFVGDPAVGIIPGGAYQVFVRAADGSVWTIAQSDMGGPFGAWQSPGGYVTSNIAIATGLTGFEIFAVGGDASIWTTSRISGGGWSPWSSLGGTVINDPVATTDDAGTVHVFALGADNGLWTNSQPPGGNWSGWTSLGGSSTGDPTIVRAANGSLEIFLRAFNNPSVINYTFQAGGAWSPILQLDVSNSGITSDPFALIDVSGNVELFWRGSDNTLWTIIQQGRVPGTATWSGNQSLGAVLAGGPAAIWNFPFGPVEAFIQCVDNTLWFVQQTSPGN